MRSKTRTEGVIETRMEDEQTEGIATKEGIVPEVEVDTNAVVLEMEEGITSNMTMHRQVLTGVTLTC